jgi:hypothetical protein
MWRKYLFAIWRNSKTSCAVRKGTPASAATIDAAQGVVQAAGSVITQYPESLPTTPPAPACPSFTPNSEQRFTPNNSQNNKYPNERSKHFPLPRIREDRRRWHGRGLQGTRHASIAGLYQSWGQHPIVSGGGVCRRNFGSHSRKSISSRLSRTAQRTWRRRWAPSADQRIGWRFPILSLTK